MPIAADITHEDLDKAIAALATVDRNIIEPEFQKAGTQTVNFLTNDLRSGVAQVSGDLRAAISGKVTQIAGADVSMVISDLVQHNGYDYAARLDKDGSLRWRTGNLRGRRTFGWFTYVLAKNAPKTVRRYFRKAVENVVTTLARNIK